MKTKDNQKCLTKKKDNLRYAWIVHHLQLRERKNTIKPYHHAKVVSQTTLQTKKQDTNKKQWETDWMRTNNSPNRFDHQQVVKNQQQTKKPYRRQTELKKKEKKKQRHKVQHKHKQNKRNNNQKKKKKKYNKHNWLAPNLSEIPWVSGPRHGACSCDVPCFAVPCAGWRRWYAGHEEGQRQGCVAGGPPGSSPLQPPLCVHGSAWTGGRCMTHVKVTHWVLGKDTGLLSDELLARRILTSQLAGFQTSWWLASFSTIPKM